MSRGNLRRAGGTAAVIAGSALWAASAFANVTAHVVTEAEKDVGIIGTAGDVKSCTGCLASISSTGTVVTQQFGTNQSDGSATASADYGVLKTFATASSNGHYGYATATASASFSDAFTIDAPGLDGQHGTVTIPLEFNYVSSRSGTATSHVTLTFQTFPGGPPETYQRSLTFHPDGTTTSDSFDPGPVVTPFSTLLLARVDFVFGQPLSFEAKLDVGGGGPFDESFTLDAAHSAYWGGFRSVTDANGDAVAYRLAPGSQADWSKSYIPLAVPEPNAYVLVLAGLCTVGFALRRR